MKNAVLQVLHSTGAFGALRHLRRHAAVVVCYHGVMPGADDRYDYLHNNFVAASAFERHLVWLSSRYRLVPLAQLISAFDRDQPLPPRAATITFDDGFANNYRVAFPILRRMGISATIFLTTGKIGIAGAQLWTERVKRAIFLSDRSTVAVDLGGVKTFELKGPHARERIARTILGDLKRAPLAMRDEWMERVEHAFGAAPLRPADAMRYDFLTWSEVREMAAAGIEFGSHTVTHPILTTLTDAQLRDELTESKRTIESELGRECYSFAYPNGGYADFGAREMAALETAGYRCAFSLEGHLVHHGAHRFALDRSNIARQYSPSLLNATLTGALADLRRATGRRATGPVGA
jgi:peptidoglycan/xylan/chitin deacetylase (PgdA/CDA1 family)